MKKVIQLFVVVFSLFNLEGIAQTLYSPTNVVPNNPSQFLEFQSGSIWNGTIRANTLSTGQYASFGLYENNTLRWSLYNNPGVNNVLLFANGSGQDKVSFTQDGKFGIGIISPQSDLDIQKNNASVHITASNATVGGVGTPYLYINRISAGLKLEYVPNVLARISNTYQGSSGNMAFSTSGYDRLMITGDGKIGMGTSTPQSDLDIRKENASLHITASNATAGGVGTPYLFINRISEGLKLEYVPNVLARISNTYQGSLGNMAFSTSGHDRLMITGDGNVGIGTTDPKYPLSVKGIINSEANGDYYGAWFGGESRTASPSVNVGAWWNNKGSIYWNSNRMYFRTQTTTTDIFENNMVMYEGKVGIGTASPTSSLDVTGAEGVKSRIHVSNSSVGGSGGYFDINMGTGDDYAAGIRAYVPALQPGIDRVYLGLYTTTYSGGLQSRVERVTISDNGNVGIGTTTPDAKLAVKGTVHTQEVKVDMLGSMVPDYVFEPTYHLRSLESLKTYIDQNKHLPEVPSAKEMEANGINLGEMNMLLLKKVEELTLHLIAQKEENELIKKELERSAEQAERATQELKLQRVEATQSMEQLIQRMEALERRNK